MHQPRVGLQTREQYICVFVLVADACASPSGRDGNELDKSVQGCQRSKGRVVVLARRGHDAVLQC